MYSKDPYPIGIRKTLGDKIIYIAHDDKNLEQLKKTRLLKCQGRVMKARLQCYHETEAGLLVPLFIVESDENCEELKARLGKFGENAKLFQAFLESQTLEEYLELHAPAITRRAKRHPVLLPGRA